DHVHRSGAAAGALSVGGEPAGRAREGAMKQRTAEDAPILVVEDDAATAEPVSLLASERFGAVLLDYRLPEGAGWPVLEAAASRVPRVPVIMVTAAGD